MAFTEDYARHFAVDLEGSQDTIQAYPDRFMWGTDRGGPAVWTYDVAVGLRLADYARASIRRLELGAREQFAYRHSE